MLRRIFSALLVFLAASAASAATLTIVPNNSFYTIGDTITLTVIGDPEGATAFEAYGRIVYNPGLASPGSTSQNPVGPAPWITGALTQGDGFAEVFNQIAPDLTPTPASNLPGVIGVVTLIVDAPGILNVDWASNLSFFGLESAPGTSICLGCEVPEPATGGLLALGLLGLAIRRGRNCA